MAQLINLTPHAVTMCDGVGNIIQKIEASGDVARLSTVTVPVGSINGIPVTSTKFGDITGLPPQCHIKSKEFIFYIVSQLVKTACPHRTDLLVPAEVVRDTEGNIIGCKSLGI